MINILLIDDHPLIRTALKIIVKDLLKDCNIDEAINSDSAIDRIKAAPYTLVIMDVSMPNTDSLALLHTILALRPGTKVLMFSMNSEEIYAKRYLGEGAMGYLRKDAGESEIKLAITTVLNNKRYISRTLAEKLAEESFHGSPANPFDRLSAREFEVVQHLIKGESVAQICKQLYLNSSTVSSHKTRIFEKLDVFNLIDLIALAKTYNLI